MARATRKATGSTRYRVLDPRAIGKKPNIVTVDGKDYGTGDVISSDEISDSAAKAWLKRGQIERA